MSLITSLAIRRLLTVACGCLGLLGLLPQGTVAADFRDQVSKSLLFHASFDQGLDADWAAGDRTLWNAASMDKRDSARAGLPAGGEVIRLAEGGKYGGALQFSRSSGPMVFYRAEGNFPRLEANWSGTISFWLSTDPDKELQDGFCDPIQITSKAWNDAAVFVEFEKRPAGIPFRLGVYADHAVWNPSNRKFEDIPAAERPLATVLQPPFGPGRWTHVAIVLQNFNTGKPDGISELYLNGQLAGTVGPREQTLTWDSQKSALMLGLNYVGKMDDLAVFGRPLTGEQVGQLFSLPGGVRTLHSPPAP